MLLIAAALLLAPPALAAQDPAPRRPLRSLRQERPALPNPRLGRREPGRLGQDEVGNRLAQLLGHHSLQPSTTNLPKKRHTRADDPFGEDQARIVLLLDERMEPIASASEGFGHHRSEVVVEQIEDDVGDRQRAGQMSNLQRAAHVQTRLQGAEMRLGVLADDEFPIQDRPGAQSGEVDQLRKPMLPSRYSSVWSLETA